MKWVRVVHADECESVEGMEREMLVCCKCGGIYADCPCPGPTMDDEYEYKFINGVMFAKEV